MGYESEAIYDHRYLIFMGATQTTISGDGNGDGCVDGGDYTIWADHYLQSTMYGPSEGDFNEDNFVDGGDYTLWADNYLKCVPVP